MSMRSGQPGINAEEYKTFEISFPCEEEQQKIASYVSGIDTKIAAVTDQITQTQTFKKGLLQQLFV
jgi:type I restriction enzyme S subunit